MQPRVQPLSRVVRNPLSLLFVVAIFFLMSSQAHAEVTAVTNDDAGAQQLADTLSPTLAAPGATFVENSGGTSAAIGDSPATDYPSFAGNFIALASGEVTRIDGSTNNPVSTDAHRSPNRGQAFDPLVLAVPIVVPAGDQCLSFDFVSYNNDGNSYDEGLVAELDTNTWSIQNGDLVAPDNFLVNSAGQAFTPQSQFSAYDNNRAQGRYSRATKLTTSTTPITPGAHTLYLSIFDEGDSIADAAAVVGNLKTSAAACDRVAAPVTYALSNPSGETQGRVNTPQTVTSTLTASNGLPMANKPVAVTVTGANASTTTEIVTTDANGVASYTYTGTNVGTDTIQFVYDQEEDTEVEAAAEYEFTYKVLPDVTTSDVSVTEGNSATDATVTVNLAESTGDTVTVDYTTVDGTADANDYTAKTGTVTFAPGETSQTVVVPVTGDTAVEGDENFSVKFSNPSNATLATDTASVVTIVNDDVVDNGGETTPVIPTLRVDGRGAVEGNSGTTDVPVTVNLDKATTRDITFKYGIAEGTARANDDYVPTGGTVTVPAGQTSVTVPVRFKGDRAFERTETLRVVLSDATGASLSADGSSATVKIINDDAKAVCRSTRKFTIHLRPTTRPLVSASVTLNGKKVKVKKLKNGRYSAVINLTGFKKGQKAVVKTRTVDKKGRVKRETRMYRPCGR